MHDQPENNHQHHGPVLPMLQSVFSPQNQPPPNYRRNPVRPPLRNPKRPERTRLAESHRRNNSKQAIDLARATAAAVPKCPYSRLWAFEIGFVWLCFLRLRLPVYYHNLLSYKTLRYFALPQIGFVFSNGILLIVLRGLSFRTHSSCLGFRA